MDRRTCVTIEHRHAFGAIDRLEEEVAESNDHLHRAQAPAVLDHSRTWPQGGGCAAPKRCPGCGGRAGASRDIPVGLRPTLTIYTCWLTRTLHGGVALLVLRRAEGLLGLLIAGECLP